MADRQKVELRKGLKDVYFDRTTASLIVAKPGRLYYRGYNIDDLARYSTFEETCYLLIYGALPTASQLEGLDASSGQTASYPRRLSKPSSYTGTPTRWTPFAERSPRWRWPTRRPTTCPMRPC